MASGFPTSLDSLTDGQAGVNLNTTPHVTVHNDANDAIEKIQAKVGINSSAVNTTHDYKLSGVATGDKAVSTAATSIKTDHIDEQTASHGIVLDKKITLGTVIQTVTAYNPADAGTTTIDLALGNDFVVTMPANTQTLAISNGTTGQFFVVEINNVTSQGALTWFTTIRWTGGTAPTLTGTNGKRDVFGFKVTGAGTYDGFVIGQNL